MDSERADQSQGALSDLGHLSLPGQLRVWRLEAVAPCLNRVEMLETPAYDAGKGAQCCALSQFWRLDAVDQVGLVPSRLRLRIWSRPLFLAVLGLCCCVGFSLVVASWCYSLVVVCRLLIAVASLAVEHGF